MPVLSRRSPLRRTLPFSFLFAVGCAVGVGATADGFAPRTSAVASACAASRVHYEKDPTDSGSTYAGLPWVEALPASVGLHGQLFYYRVGGPGISMPWFKKRDPSFKVYTHGHDPKNRFSMKIHWTGPDRLVGGRIVVHGRSNLGALYRQVVDVGPSYLNIPSAGCWTLTMTVRRETATLRVQAVDH